MTVLGLGIFGVGIYILAMRPAWFFTPPPPPESVQIQEASVRLMLVREATRVRRYRSEHGKMPATLQDAGSTVNSVSYMAQGDSGFKLVTSWGETLQILIIRSGENPMGVSAPSGSFLTSTSLASPRSTIRRTRV